MTRIALASFLLCVMGAVPAHATAGPDEGMLKPDTVELLHYVEENFPEVPSIGGWRHDAIPDHPQGRALDIMVNNDVDLGNRIHDDLLAHQDELHIRYMLWQVPNHFNHIHACVD
jgi:hypothetical protein